MWCRRAAAHLVLVLASSACGLSSGGSGRAPSADAGSGGSAGIVVATGGGAGTFEGIGGTVAGTGGSTAGQAGSGTSGGAGSSGEGGDGSAAGGVGGSAAAPSGGTGPEDWGCVVAPRQGCDAPAASFACSRDLEPESCAYCTDPNVPNYQCFADAPDGGVWSGGGCKWCCCEPSRGGCQRDELADSGCASYQDAPRAFDCVQPYTMMPGCIPHSAFVGRVVELHCCP
jgi:hypothetical protein